MPFITAQSDILLTQGILQPWQLSESYLADITGILLHNKQVSN